MKLATLRAGGRDGTLLVVTRDGSRATAAGPIAPTLQAALDDWTRAEPRLRALADRARSGAGAVAAARRARAARAAAARLRVGRRLGVPEPRDPGAQGARRRAARDAAQTDPLVYQGGSGVLLGPTDDIPLRRRRLGARLRVGGLRHPRRHAAGHARRRRRPRTSGCCCSRTTSRCATSSPPSWPRASASSSPSRRPPSRRSPSRPTSSATPGATAACTCACARRYNGALVGDCDAGPEMHFSFFDLIAHLARRARSPPARSSAAARCRTPIARAASPASPSAG